MNHDRFSNLSIMNIEKDNPINNEDILNIFEKTERRITLFHIFEEIFKLYV